MTTQANYLDIQGARIPALGFGTGPLKGRACQEAVTRALELGYRHLDTAQLYENEYEVGRALDSSGLDSNDVFVTTKIKPENMRAQDVIDSSRDSRDRLGVDRIDLLLIHWPSPEVELAETLEAMQRLQADGVTLHVGVSNFDPEELARAAELAPIVCDQVELHPLRNQSRLVSLAQRLELAVIGHQPLARGDVDEHPTLRQIAKDVNKTPAQVSLRWLLQQPNVGAIPRASTPDHARENLEALTFELSPAQMQAIHAIGGDDVSDTPGVDTYPSSERVDSEHSVQQRRHPGALEASQSRDQTRAARTTDAESHPAPRPRQSGTLADRDDAEDLPVTDPGVAIAPEDRGPQALRDATQQDNFESDAAPVAPRGPREGEVLSDASLESAGQQGAEVPKSGALAHEELDVTEPQAGEVDLTSRVVRGGSLFEQPTTADEEAETQSPRLDTDELDSAETDSDAREEEKARRRQQLRHERPRPGKDDRQ